VLLLPSLPPSLPRSGRSVHTHSLMEENNKSVSIALPSLPPSLPPHTTNHSNRLFLLYNPSQSSLPPSLAPSPPPSLLPLLEFARDGVPYFLDDFLQMNGPTEGGVDEVDDQGEPEGGEGGREGGREGSAFFG